MSLFSSILPCLLAAFALGALLGWALKSLLGDRKLIDLETAWATKLRGKESEWQTSTTGLRSQLNTLQTNYAASSATLRSHEASLAEWDTKHSALETSLAEKTADFDKANALWHSKYDAIAASLAAKTVEFDQARGGLEAELRTRTAELDLVRQDQAKWQARLTELEQALAEKNKSYATLEHRVGELEPLGGQVKDWEMKFLQVSGDKEAEVKELQRKVSELEPLRTQTKDWELKYTAMLQERESETSKLRHRIAELEPLSVQVNDWQARYQSTVAEKDQTISSLQKQLSATGSAGTASAGSSAAPASIGDLLEIEGIGETYWEKLNAIGLNWQAQLLDRGATKKGRIEIAETSGIAEKLVLRWVNHIDLIRINGIGPQYAELLEVAGVDSVPELAQRNAENLHAKLVEVNDGRHLVGRVASVSEVTDWILQAKELPRVVTH
jgi:predicted flap endonuclease-1-like 5' DNA nuclease